MPVGSHALLGAKCASVANMPTFGTTRGKSKKIAAALMQKREQLRTN